MTVAIWYRYGTQAAEKVDEVAADDVGVMVAEYRMAYALNPGQSNHGKAKLWAGLKKDEPTKEGSDVQRSG